MLAPLYGTSLALLTDLYQLTMAYGYYKHGMADREAVFTLYFRNNPFGNPYTIAAGLEQAVDYLRRFRFTPDDLSYLATLTGNDGRLLFDHKFLSYLGQMELSVDVDAVAEGTVVFPNQPLLRVRGSLLQAQLLETALLNIINFQSLIATKASRVVRAAQGDTVLEFGLRRAQGVDGGMSASRAAYIGGCHATSNVLAGKLLGIPVRGTHAHSWVMCFDSEPDAFMHYAQAMPNNCTFLVDTYDTLGGVQNAIAVGKWLAERGHRLAAIRLDSGDLAALSTAARQLLDEAGFVHTRIVASNDLDEHSIAQLKAANAPIAVWGVGTKLVTAFDQPALGGVYKLSAIQDHHGQWQPRIKHSQTPAKASTPGLLQVRRYHQRGQWIADMLFDELQSPFAQPNTTIVAHQDTQQHHTINDQQLPYTHLLQPIFRGGIAVYNLPALSDIRQYAAQQMQQIHATKGYVWGWEKSLYDRRQAMLQGGFLYQHAPITQLIKGTNIRQHMIDKKQD